MDDTPISEFGYSRDLVFKLVDIVIYLLSFEVQVQHLIRNTQEKPVVVRKERKKNALF